MRYRINQIKLKPGEGMEALEKAVAAQAAKAAIKKTKGKLKIENLQIRRESIDARRKPEVKLIYTVDFDCDTELKLDQAVRKEYSLDIRREELDYTRPAPVIAGFGPCGIFAALILAEAGLKPIVIERGRKVDERIADVENFQNGKTDNPDPESNVQFGEGGAGTFSDGKLTTGIKDVRISKVLSEFVKAGADPEIMYMHRPHIGTDRLREIIPVLRKYIESLGGQVRFNTRLTDLVTEDNRLKAIEVLNRESGKAETIETDRLILATGHSARDTFRMLRDRGLSMRQKPFSMGVRIEHPQEMINRAQYGDPKLAEILGAADYKLNHRCENGRGVYTFCMCPGGVVINASTEPETQVTNGMSNAARDSETANSALLVDVRTEDYAHMGQPEYGGEDPLAGIEFQRKYEKLAWQNKARSTYGEFRKNSNDPVRASLPGFASEAMIEAMPFLGRKLRGFDMDEAVMTAVESRSSSPVRVWRDENLQASLEGLMPAGEGPGYAGGIMSAAVDGIRVAEQVIRDYRVIDGEEI